MPHAPWMKTLGHTNQVPPTAHSKALYIFSANIQIWPSAATRAKQKHQQSDSNGIIMLLKQLRSPNLCQGGAVVLITIFNRFDQGKSLKK